MKSRSTAEWGEAAAADSEQARGQDFRATLATKEQGVSRRMTRPPVGIDNRLAQKTAFIPPVGSQGG